MRTGSLRIGPGEGARVDACQRRLNFDPPYDGRKLTPRALAGHAGRWFAAATGPSGSS
jgi:hypothetical protein